jgi:putative ATP-dependent endonuclease of OLD family
VQLTSVRLQGFRNLNCSINLCGPLSLIVGENNNGKSNLIDAIRLVLRALAYPSHQLWVTPEDFPHDGHGVRVADAFEIEAIFTDLSDRQLGRMVSCLSPSLGPNVARLRLRASLGPRDRPVLTWLGGDDDHDELEPYARTAVTYTYLHPLRNALTDLRPGRSNRLVSLLKSTIGVEADGEVGPDGKLLEDIMQQANASLGAVPAVIAAKQEIQRRVDEMIGSGYRQQVDLAFAEPVLDRILARLRTLAGDLDPLELAENGLGYNNILYMATLLAGLDKEPDGELHLLLVEEPEAHLHPQLQDLLTRYLEREAAGRVQVVVTTHSPNLAAATGVERVTAMARPTRHGAIVGRDLASFGLTEQERGHLRRFLDATKASLLFARGVLLVEGVAEQLVVPFLAEALGVSLPAAGVSVINVGGLAFRPFARLFHPDRLPYRCAIVSDGDRLRTPTDDDDDDGDTVDESSSEDSPEPALSATAQSLLTLKNDNLRVFLSDQTFEWDLVRCGNWETTLQALALLKPRVAARLLRDHASSSTEAKSWALLKAVEDSKGIFAQALTQVVATNGATLAVPPYLAQALRWVTGLDDSPTDEALGDSATLIPDAPAAGAAER